MESISLALLMTRSPFGDLKPASAVGRKTWSKWAPATHLWEPLDPEVASARLACTHTRFSDKADLLILKAVLGSGPRTGAPKWVERRNRLSAGMGWAPEWVERRKGMGAGMG